MILKKMKEPRSARSTANLKEDYLKDEAICAIHASIRLSVRSL